MNNEKKFFRDEGVSMGVGVEDKILGMNPKESGVNSKKASGWVRFSCLESPISMSF